MRPPTQSMVTEHGSQDQLDVENEDRQQRQRKHAGTAGVELGARLFFHPLPSGENSHGDGDAEECLGEGGVRGGDRRRKKEDDGEASENALSNDGTEGSEAENPHPAAPFNAPCPDRKNDRHEAGSLGDHAMRVLESNAANKFGNLVERAEGSRPV